MSTSRAASIAPEPMQSGHESPAEWANRDDVDERAKNMSRHVAGATEQVSKLFEMGEIIGRLQMNPPPDAEVAAGLKTRYQQLSNETSAFANVELGRVLERQRQLSEAIALSSAKSDREIDSDDEAGTPFATSTDIDISI